MDQLNLSVLELNCSGGVLIEPLNIKQRLTLIPEICVLSY